MTLRSWMASRPAVVALALALVATGLIVTPAASAAGPPKRIYACVTEAFQTLNMTTKGKPCPPGQTKVSWGVDGARPETGKPGKRGPRGATGPNGPTGPTGPTGAAQGTEGPAGSADTPRAGAREADHGRRARLGT